MGDTGISPLEHTGAYAAFANGGHLAKPYGVLEIVNSKGDVLYARDRDEQPAPLVLKPRVVAEMNQMMQAVVNEGTGKRAALEITQAVGKTGTSSSYRDAWFMGFTGQSVTGVWLGNDDFRPMMISSSAGEVAHGVTGGGLPAQTWQAFMTVAHPSAGIPTIPGLSPHPRQVQELQRLAELKRTEPALAAAQAQGARRSIMPDATRDSLRKLADTLRRIAGLPAAPNSGAPAGSGTATQGRQSAAPEPTDAAARDAAARGGDAKQPSGPIGPRADASDSAKALVSVSLPSASPKPR